MITLLIIFLSTSQSTMGKPSMPDMPTKVSFAFLLLLTACLWNWPPPSPSKMTNFPTASVASDMPVCSKAGTDVLLEGGNAVDAWIATLTCLGVVKPQSTGLGGGFMLTFYNSSAGKCQSLIARETAPASAKEDMYVGRRNASFMGYGGIATPGELHGLWTAYNRFGSGNVSWSRLLRPAIDLARNGFPISKHYVYSIDDPIIFYAIQNISGSLKELVFDPSTNKIWKKGTIIKREKYADTLEALANATDPVELFYQGRLAETIVEEMKRNGGHLELEDLANYKTKIVEHPPTASILGEFQMCGPPPPSSFVITQSIIQTMAEFYKENPDFNDPLLYHRVIEAQKFAYARRTELGDVDFVYHTRELLANMTEREYAKSVVELIKGSAQPADYYGKMDQKTNFGTSHISVIDQNGNAVSATSSINYSFGSMTMSPTLGIVWNNAMDDFSTPGVSNYYGYAPSPTNFIKPGKRPMSSFSPMVVYNKKTRKVKMVIGSAGGSHIISGVSQVATRTLIFDQTVKEANDAPRLHNQFLPHVTQWEKRIPKHIIDSLSSLHQYKQSMVPYADTYSTVNVLKVRDDDGSIDGNCDHRREPGNAPDGF